MSRLKDLVSKGVRLIVVDSEHAPGEVAPPAPPQERDLPPEAFAAPPPTPRTARSQVAADVADFGAVYEEAGIELPPHGYGVDKVADMLQSKRLASLGREVKATAVMAALEAAQVPVRDVIQDAVQRDGALDAFEEAKQREVQEIKTRNEERIRSLQADMEALLRKINEEVEKLKTESTGAEQAFQQLQERKRREEQRLFDVVSHFIEGGSNPVTTGAPAAKPPSPRPGS